MIKKLINNIKNMEENVSKIMIKGLYFSFIILLISFFISFIYTINPISHILFICGVILFKTGLTFGIMFFISAFVIDNLKKELNH